MRTMSVNAGRAGCGAHRYSTAAADAVRGLSDEALDKASPISLNWDAPLTTQFFIEDHPISHPYLHLNSIRAALNK